MHAQIAAENPGLSNPQISQVLGDRWAKESDEVKAQWKTLAIEESKRHSQQYPGYKYQPRRRGSKVTTHIHTHPPDEETGRCGKCHGRYHKNPPTPSLPPPSVKAKVDHLPSPASASARSAAEEAYRPRPEPLTSIARSARPAEDLDLVSPEVKRRRLVDAAESRAIAPIRVNAYSRKQPVHSARMTPTSEPYSATRSIDSPLPHVGGVPRAHGGAMPPPPRPAINSGWSVQGYSYPGRSGIADESLRLPPLQTAIPPPHSPARDTEARYGYHTPVNSAGMPPSTRDSPEKSAQEQIMAIPYSRKLGVLGKICPPLPRHSSGHGSDSQARGPVIAIEGSQSTLLQEVGQCVEKALRVAPEDISLQVYSRSFPTNVPVQDEMGTDKEAPTAELLDLIPTIFKHIAEWHEKSKNMSQHVQGSMIRVAQGGSNEESSQPSGVDSTVSTPVALVKDGFSLTVSDKFSCCTSHAVSNYSPVDHWQWMATLWRGIVGPDLVVYVKPSTEEEISKHRNVEIHLEKLGLIVVRIDASKGLDEATERRLAFEVIEWMRSGWIRDSRPRSS